MLLADLTFGQELAKAAVGPVLTAVLVTVGGGLAVNVVGKQRDDRRQRFELRTTLLERTSRVAGTMFITCQHVSRLLRGGLADAERKAVLADLDAKYQAFSVEATVVEQELGARFGFHRSLSQGKPDGLRVFERWHQIADLLTVYVFNLKGGFPGDMLKNNTRGHDGRYHTGLDLPAQAGDLHAMRTALRRTYREAREDLVQRLLEEPITV